MSRAVVVGGSLAGSMCARVLADRFDEVVMVDRDDLSGGNHRRGVPQGRHIHALWYTGLAAMERLFPGLVDELREGGAVFGDVGRDWGWWQLGTRRSAVTMGVSGASMTRLFLEKVIRARAVALSNVELRSAHVCGLTATGERVDGVMVSGEGADDRQRLPADVVVDCSGRGSQLGAWLSELGYKPPEPERVDIEQGYVTRMFDRPPGQWLSDGTAGLASLPAAPGHPRSAVVVAVEGDRWLVGISGFGSDRPSPDGSDFVARCRSERVPALDHLIETARPISEAFSYRLPSSIRRDYHKMARFPAGLYMAGDAVASFDPIYGQGMTCAARHAVALEEHLGGHDDSASSYLRRIKRVTDAAWVISVAEDFRLPTTKGRAPRGIGLIHRLGNSYAKGSVVEPELQRRFLQVASMEVRPLALLSPPSIWRLMKTELGQARRSPDYLSLRNGGA